MDKATEEDLRVTLNEAKAARIMIAHLKRRRCGQAFRLRVESIGSSSAIDIRSPEESDALIEMLEKRLRRLALATRKLMARNLRKKA